METRVTVHTQSQTNRNLHLFPGLALLLVLEPSKVPGHLLIMRHRKAFGAHVPENLHRDQVIAACAPFERSSVFCLSTRIPGRSMAFESQKKKKKDHWIPKVREEKCSIANWLWRHRTRNASSSSTSFDWFSQRMLLFTLHTFAIDEPHGRMQGWCHPTVRMSKTKRQLHNVRWTSTMYWVHLDSGANQGEIPGIGESPSNQPISGQVIFSKRQALSRAVVVNSNISRGKYLAREGPGSRLICTLLRVAMHFDQAVT